MNAGLQIFLNYLISTTKLHDMSVTCYDVYLHMISRKFNYWFRDHLQLKLFGERTELALPVVN